MSPQSAKQPVELSIVMPAFNEGPRIYDNILKVCHDLKEKDFEIIVVDDGSTDDTYSESQRAAAGGFPVCTVRMETNSGKGASLFRGFEESCGRLVAFLDSDLEIPPHYILELLSAMQATGADVVAGVKDPVLNHFPWPRQLMSRVYRATVGFLFGLNITDTQTGIKLFKREVLESTIPRLRVSRFAFDIELLIAASRFGYEIVEYPVEVAYARAGGLGRMRPGHVFGTFADTLAIYFRASFWRWLEPGLSTQLWMMLFVLGIFLAGVGFAKILTPIILQPPFNTVARIIFLQFLPTALRDRLLAIGGTLLVVLSLIQLNKSLLKAFARRDRGDLAGIFRK